MFEHMIISLWKHTGVCVFGMSRFPWNVLEKPHSHDTCFRFNTRPAAGVPVFMKLRRVWNVFLSRHVMTVFSCQTLSWFWDVPLVSCTKSTQESHWVAVFQAVSSSPGPDPWRKILRGVLRESVWPQNEVCLNMASEAQVNIWAFNVSLSLTHTHECCVYWAGGNHTGLISVCCREEWAAITEECSAAMAGR